MTEPSHTTYTPAGGSRPGMTEAEIMRNIAIKTSNRPATDNQGRITDAPTSIEYHHDDRGRIVGATTTTHEVPTYNPITDGESPGIQAMREKAARNQAAFERDRANYQAGGTTYLETFHGDV